MQKGRKTKNEKRVSNWLPKNRPLNNARRLINELYSAMDPWPRTMHVGVDEDELMPRRVAIPDSVGWKGIRKLANADHI